MIIKYLSFPKILLISCKIMRKHSEENKELVVESYHRGVSSLLMLLRDRDDGRLHSGKEQN